MAWPDYSELSFGYAFLSEFERQHMYGGYFFRRPPVFISQSREALEGYDVEIALSNGTPIFIQLKRSFVVERSNAKESLSGWSFPSYRMYLRKKRNFDQHHKLQSHARRGRHVLYVTSKTLNSQDMWNLYHSNSLLASGCKAFSPLDIPRPTDMHDHWVSFNTSGSMVRRYSAEPIPIEDTVGSLPEYLAKLGVRPSNLAENVERLNEFTREVVKADPWIKPLLDEVEVPFRSFRGTARGVSPSRLRASVAVAQASLAARVALDAQLKVVRAPPDLTDSG